MSSKSAGKMVYEWDDKETECYQLYVEERKSLDEVMEHMRSVHNFNPSKRAFQTQFRRWEFPSKQNPAHKNSTLVDRIHELWEANTSQKDMLHILNAEGHPIKERELMRVRAKHRWLLRVPNGTKTFGSNTAAKKGTKRKRDEPGDATGLGDGEEERMREMERVVMEENAAAEQNVADKPSPSPDPAELLSPEIQGKHTYHFLMNSAHSPQEKRKQRLEKLQAESAERWATKKRRRRTRGWAGLPADPPGPPRFPSETTIDESKAYLHLDNELYRQIRDQFQGICEEAGFLKKTVAGPEKWQAAKDRLIAENAHMQNEFLGPPNGVSPESKALALDVVCTDVTKRMRTLERRMTIAEAKNALHINPEQSREIRNQFYDVLKADHFTSKLEAGDDHWNDLKNQWIAGSELLQQILAAGDADPQYSLKVKAIEVLCRDVMKRLRDDQTKRDPSRKKQVNAGPGPGPAPPKIARAIPAFPPYAPAASMVPASSDPKAGLGQSDLQIDPSLLAAASDPSLDVTLQLQQFAAEAAQGHEYPPTGPFVAPSQFQPVPVYFRLHHSSTINTEPRVWIGSLTSISLTQLVQSAIREHPHATHMKFAGVVSDEHGGGETLYPIDRDDELEAYLHYVGDNKPTISVQLGVESV